MVDAVNNVNNLQSLMAINGVNADIIRAVQSGKQTSQDEFLAMFYKEILKQSIKPSTLGFSDDSTNAAIGMYGADVLLEKLAIQLADDQSASSIFDQSVAPPVVNQVVPEEMEINSNDFE